MFLGKDHEINGKTVEVKRAISKDVRPIIFTFAPKEFEKMQNFKFLGVRLSVCVLTRYPDHCAFIILDYYTLILADEIKNRF